MGAALGIGVASLLLRLLDYLSPPAFSGIDTASLNTTILTFTAGTALLTGLCCGAWPAWQAARIHERDGFREPARGATAGPSQPRWSLTGES
jgi:hypothetical protein